jgi:hypothetical protein
LGFINVKWRKGTGLSSSPADRGRDIEGQLERKDVDGSVHVETWFVECKHYLKGVPPDKIQGAISWATAKRPDTLLIIASNFLSNPTVDFIEEYRNNNSPSFRVKVWERTDLERLTASNYRLLRKFNIPSEISFVSIVHPAHLLYVRKHPYNTLDYLFEVLDRLDFHKRDMLMSWVYNIIIEPRMREPVTGDESIADLYIDEVSYESFKVKCYEKAEYLNEKLLVLALVTEVLQDAFAISDTTSTDEKIEEHNKSVKYMESLLENEEQRMELKEIFESDSRFKGVDIFSKEGIKEHILHAKEMMGDFEERVKQNYDLYVYFCENVIKELMKQKIIY